jgi:heterodisulfide reductase subunit B
MKMKKYVLYPGCLMPTEQYAYELSIRSILPAYDIELIDIEGFSCCGEPMKSVNQFLTLYLSARNLALSEANELDMFIPCPMCHLALSECNHILNGDEKLREKINSLLDEEGLQWRGETKLVHTVDLFHHVIGTEKIKQSIKKPLSGLVLAPHYGCHLIRPSAVGRPVNPEDPQMMETLLHAIGVETMPYAEKLDCCGAPLLANLPDSALTKAGQKMQAVQEQNYDGLVTMCPWCHKMFDARQKKAAETVASDISIPVVYFTQLLGVALGIEEKRLGFEFNLSPVDKLLEKIK